MGFSPCFYSAKNNLRIKKNVTLCRKNHNIPIAYDNEIYKKFFDITSPLWEYSW